MTREDMVLALSIINHLLTWGVALYMYMANKNKATNERINKLEDDMEVKLDTHTTAEEAKFDEISRDLRVSSERIQHLETAATAAPSHADLAKVYDSLNALAGTVNQLVGENRGQSDTLRLILNQITKKGME